MTSAARTAGRRSRAALVLLLLPVTACAPLLTPPVPGPAVREPSTVDAGTAATDVVTELTTPWSMVVAGDSVLVSERDTGRIVEVTAAHDVREVITVAGVRHGGEGGLLGLALDPAGEHLYAYSTADAGNRVQRYDLGGEPGALTLSAPAEVVAGVPSAGNHNGGRIAFGPDGMLYVTVGDAGDRAAAQDLDALAGKILRLEPDGTVPVDNPFPGSPVYSYGHRNPQGIAWTADGRMFASEFGQDTWDELNVIEPGGNYGWPDVEGIAGDDAYIDPVQVWAPAEASPSGLAAIGDTLYLANLRGERLRAIPIADPTTSTELLAHEFGRLRDVTQGPDGRIWVSTSNRGGRGTAAAGDDRIVSLEASQSGG